jgi:hypothetical protein
MKIQAQGKGFLQITLIFADNLGFKNTTNYELSTTN